MRPTATPAADAGRVRTYAIITPARDEIENLPRLGASIAAQHTPPARWVIVDDHSDDGSHAWAQAFAAEHPYADAVAWDGPEGGELAAGRREGRDLHAFRFGIGRLPAPVDVVVKVDADTSFAPDYFTRLLAHFEAAPDLGIAGGACLEEENGSWVVRRTDETHPRGASRAYRRDCLPDLMELEPKMGWDGLDEIKVGLRGYRTQQFPDLEFRHHRPEGGRERGRLHARSVSGRASWYMGYRPSFLALRSLYNARRDPAALAMLWGYAAAGLARTPRCPDAEVVRALRDRQRLRVVLRRGAARA